MRSAFISGGYRQLRTYQPFLAFVWDAVPWSPAVEPIFPYQRASLDIVQYVMPGA
jgi:hypothetical protein